MALRSGQGQRKKYLTMDLSNLSTFVRNLRAVVSEFQFAKIGDQYPPWGYGVDATAHTMPQSRVSCHLCDAVAPSFFKNLLQQGVPPSPLGAPLSPWHSAPP